MCFVDVVDMVVMVALNCGIGVPFGLGIIVVFGVVVRVRVFVLVSLK